MILLLIGFLINQKYIRASLLCGHIEENIVRLAQMSTAVGGTSDSESKYDQYFAEAGRFVIDKDKASIGMLQRVFKIGFNRAAKIMDELCKAGVFSEEEGIKPRK